MNILVADYSGFCFGVRKAVSTAYGAKNENGRIFTYGPIIHNSKVVNELKSKGIRPLNSMDEICESDTVIIRSHGVSKDVISSLKEKGVNIIDATCPYVDSIHKKVEEYFEKGYQIVIIGDPDHPEIIGINGWCENSAIIIDNTEKTGGLRFYPRICVVAQTTMNIGKWKDIVAALLDKSREMVIFNTICNATEQRQKAAEELSKKCDAVIVLGGYNSSNTKKLVDICSANCPRTYHVESIDELNYDNLKGIDTLGITAGASTPDWIIKEAINKMSNINNPVEENNEQSLLMNDYEKTLVRLHDGDIVRGRIIYTTDNEATVDVGYKTDGIIPKDEIYLEEGTSIKDVLKAGDEIEVYVLKVNDGEGNVLLSKKKVDAEKNIEFVEEAYNNKTIVDANVTGIVKGGVIAEVKGVRVFIPASQLDVKYVEDLNVFSGKVFKIAIIEFDGSKRRIIGSRKQVLAEEIKAARENKLNTLAAGDIISGTVSRLADFGAFVDLGGIDGLIHISELSWGRVKHPSEVVKEGQKVEVYVISVDKEKERISLSLRKTIPDPWETVSQNVHAGDIIEGKVVRTVPFGAFVEIESGVDGLVHISQISEKRINKVEDVLKVGDTVKAKVVEINLETKKISLSIKDAVEDEMKKENESVLNDQPQDNVTVADMIKNE